MHPLCGKIAVVTGGTKGLGLAIALSLAEAGAKVVAASRHADLNAEPIERITWDRVDVTDPDSLDALMLRTAHEHGGPQIVVANAGITVGGRLTRISAADWKAIVDTNLSGTFHTIRAAAALIEPPAEGRIITISSCMADNPAVGAVAYAASKAGIQALTMGAAQELAPRIVVSCIAPGILDTGMGEAVADDERLWDRYRPHLALGRRLTAKEIGSLVAFAAGPHGAVFNGQTIRADGGHKPWA